MSFNAFGDNRTIRAKFVGDTHDLDAKMVESAGVAEEASKRIGDAFTTGTTRAARQIEKLGTSAAAMELPFAASLDNISKKFDAAESHATKFSGVLADAGKLALVGLGAGFAGVATEAVKMASAMQTATASIASTSDISQKAATAIGNAFLNTAGKSVFSGEQMATAFASVAGQLKLTEGHALTTGQALRFETTASDLAVASHSSLAEATNAVATAMQAYHLSVGQASAASDTLFNVSRAINAPLGTVTTALTRLHGRLGELSPSLKEVGGLAMELANYGVSGSRGIRQVSTAMLTLTGSSKKVTEVLGALGVHVFDSQGKFVGLQSVIGQLQPKMAGLTQQQQIFVASTLFGKQVAMAMTQVIRDGVPRFEEAQKAAGKLGTAHRAAAIQAKTLHDELETLKSTVIDLGTKFGEWLVPKMQAFGAIALNVVNWLEQNKGAAIALASAVGTILSAAIAAYTYSVGVKFLGTLNAMKDSLLGLIAKFTGTGAAATATGTEVTAMGEATAATTPAIVSFDSAVSESTMALGTMTGEAAAVAPEIEGIGAAAAAATPEVAALDTALGEGGLLATLAAIPAAIAGVVSGLAALAAPLAAVAAPLAALGFGISQIPVNAPHKSGGVVMSRFGTPQLGALQRAAARGRGGFMPFTSMSGMANVGGIAIPQHGSNANRIAMALAMQGFDKNAIAGILGNFAQETGGGNINAINTRDTGTGASGMGGMGIAQWTGLRRAQEMQFAASHHLSPTSLDAQIAYLITTLRGSTYHPAFKAAQNASSPAAAAALFNQLYEGGTDPHAIRERVAKLAAASGVGNPAIAALLHTAEYGKPKKPKAAKAIRSLLYANPLPGMTSVGRDDMGLDLDATAGSAVNAMGAGVITNMIANWYKGQPLVEERLTQGPNKGKYVYYAEQLKSLVRIGQQVAAGQRIGTVASSGTGLELGFGARGGLTLAQAQHGQWAANPSPGQKTPWGEAFRKFYEEAVKGVYRTTKAGVTTGGGSSIAFTLSNLTQAFYAALQKNAQATLTKYGNLEQSGSVRTLFNALGVRTTGGVSRALFEAIEHPPHMGIPSPRHAYQGYLRGRGIATAFNTLHGSASAVEGQLVGILTHAAAHSPQQAAFNRQIGGLRAAGENKLADRLVAAHKAAMETLAQEIFAEQKLKDAESLQLQATQLRDQTTAVMDEARDQQTLAQDRTKKLTDIFEAAAQAIRDWTQTTTDIFAAMAQQVTDQTTQMADAANAVVEGINDQTQIQVDILGERGLYGLNLIAQKLQVTADTVKAQYDQQIAAAQQNLDALKAQWNATVAAKQIAVDQVQAAEDALVALSQQSADTTQIHADIQVARAQAHSDAVMLAQDVAVQLAQAVVDLSATASKAQQDVANAQLKRATAAADLANAQANQALTNAQMAGMQAVSQAQNALAIAQGQATEAEAGAQQALADAQGQSALAIAQATQSLTDLQDNASIAEAQANAAVAVAREQAATEFAGTGTVVNIYGVPTENAAAIGQAVDWVARTQLH